jgi:glutathione S-transferase
MVTVHHLNNSRSQRVLWLLEELGTPYEIVKYERDPQTKLAPPELRKVHPLGKSPVVTDDGVTVAESAVILEYLVDKYGEGRLAPARATPEFQRYRYFMHYAEGSLMPYLVMKLVTSRMRKAPFIVRPVAKAIAGKVDDAFVMPNLERHIAFLDGELAQRPYFAGSHFTLADIQMSYPMEALTARASDIPQRLKDYVARIHDRPAYKRAVERGGPYSVIP